jgi:hypothetical protein
MHHKDLYCAFTQLGEREGVDGPEATIKAGTHGGEESHMETRDD